MTAIPMAYNLLPAVSTTYLASFLNSAKELNAPMSEILDGTSISSDELEEIQVGLEMISIGDFETLINNLSRYTKNSVCSLGLYSGLRFKISAHGQLGFAGIHSSNLDSAINLMTRFLPLASPLVQMNFLQEETKAIIEIDFQDYTPLSIKTHLLAFILANLHSMSIEMFGKEASEKLYNTKVEFATSLNLDLEEWAFEQDIAEFVFNRDKTRVIFNGAFATLKIPSANEHAFRSANSVCEFQLQQFLNNDDIVAKILQRLQMAEDTFPSMEDLAKEMCQSPRTLHRHLKARNCSYREILSSVKMDRARKLLMKDELSITEVAFQLGYTDAANFSNAFKRTHGFSPSQIKSEI